MYHWQPLHHHIWLEYHPVCLPIQQIYLSVWLFARLPSRRQFFSLPASNRVCFRSCCLFPDFSCSCQVKIFWKQGLCIVGSFVERYGLLRVCGLLGQGRDGARRLNSHYLLTQTTLKHRNQTHVLLQNLAFHWHQKFRLHGWGRLQRGQRVGALKPEAEVQEKIGRISAPVNLLDPSPLFLLSVNERIAIVSCQAALRHCSLDTKTVPVRPATTTPLYVCGHGRPISRRSAFVTAENLSHTRPDQLCFQTMPLQNKCKLSEEKELMTTPERFHCSRWCVAEEWLTTEPEEVIVLPACQLVIVMSRKIFPSSSNARQTTITCWFRIHLAVLTWVIDNELIPGTPHEWINTEDKSEAWRRIQFHSFNEETQLYSSHDLPLMYILMTSCCLLNLETLFRCSMERSLPL